jgi:hypothetical protein
MRRHACGDRPLFNPAFSPQAAKSIARMKFPAQFFGLGLCDEIMYADKLKFT